MTPAYDLINSPPSPFPFLELKQDQQLQFFINPTHHNQASSSLSSPIFFNITHDQRSASTDHPGEPHKNQHKADKYIWNGRSSDHPTSSPSIQPRVDSTEHRPDELLIFKVKHYEDEDQREVISSSANQWMSSKMRLMRRSTESPHNNNIIRVCSDCNTTKTPLWRSGPQGPKSLCNACGIRQRKARRAMAAAAAAAASGNGTVHVTNNSTTRTDHQAKKKEKKLRTSYTSKYKKPFKQEKISTFEDFAMSLSKKYSAIRRAFPKDEEEAAILLMALSCGFLAS